MKIVEHCRACGNPSFRKAYSQVEDYYFNTRFVGDTLFCKQCESIHNPMGEPTSEEYENYYTSNQNERFRERIYNKFKFFSVVKEINLWANGVGPTLQGLKPPLKIFDYGCGSGNFGQYLASKGHNVHLFDPFEVPLAVDCNVHDALQKVPSDFDVIFLNHVVEHLDDPLQTICKLKRKLKKGGRIIVSTPNAKSLSRVIFKKYWRGLEYPRHRCVFSPSGISQLAERAGLSPTTYLLSRSSREMGFVSIKLTLARFLYSRFVGYSYQIIHHYLSKISPELNEELFVVMINDT